VLILNDRDSQRRVSESTLQLVREIHAMMNGDRPLLLQRSMEAEDIMNGEAELIICREAEIDQPSGNESVSVIDGQPPSATAVPSSSSIILTGQSLQSSSSTELALAYGPAASATQGSNGTCIDRCKCNCHTPSMYLPFNLDPVQQHTLSSGFTTRFVQRCSIRECRTRKIQSEASKSCQQKLSKAWSVSLC
jgi:hypothetical protein